MRCSILILLAVISIGLQAQPKWTNYTSGNNVSDVLEHEGATYIATDGGLCIYKNNETEPEFYNRGNSALPTNNVRYLEMDDNGTLLMTTTKGLCAFDGETVSWLDAEVNGPMTKNDVGIWIAGYNYLSLYNNGILTNIDYHSPYFFYTDILSDTTGDIWVAYYTFGIFGVARWNGEQWSFWDHSNSDFPFESPVNNQLAMDADGEIYCLNWGGLFEFDGETFVNLAPLPFENAWNLGGLEWIDNWMINGMTTSTINEDGEFNLYSFENGTWENNNLWHSGYFNAHLIDASQGEFYVATTNRGCSYLDFDSFQFLLPINSSATTMDNNVVSSMTVAPNNQVDFVNGYYNNGGELFKVVNGELNVNNYPFLGEDEVVLSVEHDNDGNLWVVADNIYKYDGETWEIFTTADVGLTSDFVRGDFAIAANGDVWITQWVNILQYTNGNWVLHTNAETGWDYNTQTVAFDPISQRVYVAYLFKVLYFDGTGWQSLDNQQIEGENYIYDLVFDETGIMWVLKDNAVLTYNGETVEVYNQFNSPIESDFVPRELGINNGDVWVGGVGKAALKTGDSWELFDNTNSGIANNEIVDIDFTIDGHVWFAHQGGGISVYNPDGVGLGFKPLVINKVKPLNVFPNPILSGEHFSVDLQSLNVNNAKMLLQVFDVNGQLIMQKAFDPANSYCTFQTPNNISAGQYTVIAKGGGLMFSGKVVVVE